MTHDQTKNIPEGWGSVETGSDFIPDDQTPEKLQAIQEYQERAAVAGVVLGANLVFLEGEDKRGRNVGNIADAIARATDSPEKARHQAEVVVTISQRFGMDKSLTDYDVPMFLSAVPQNLQYDNVAQKILELASEWGQSLMHNDLRSDERTTRARVFNDQLRTITGSSGSVSNEPHLTPTETADIFHSATAAYVLACDMEAHADSPKKKGIIKSWVQKLSVPAVTWRDAAQTTHAANVYERIMTEDDETAEIAHLTLVDYMFNAPLDDVSTNAFTNVIIPRVRQKDASISAVLRASEGSAGGTGHDLFGIATFEVRELVNMFTPTNIREGINILRSIPTSSVHRFESNRLDALQLAASFGPLRDFIHDQRPGVHELLEAMLSYNEDNDSAALIKIAEQHNGYFDTDERIGRLLNLETYGSIRPSRKLGNVVMPDEPIIDILKRLERNTRPIDDTPPELLDEQLAERLRAVYEAKPGETKQLLTDATRFVNDRTSSQIADKKVGIEPEFISALAWLENEQFKYLQKLKFEDQAGLARQETFQQILLMHELTHNDEYDPKEFTDFMESLTRTDDLHAARTVAKRVVGQVSALANTYIKRGKREWADALWSGNVTHELMGMIDAREATTALGKKIRAERHGVTDAY